MKWALVELRRAGQKCFVVDLSGVSFVDSTALGVLVAFQRGLPPDGRLAIALTNPAVRGVFEVTGLDQSFSLFGTADAAIAHVQRD